MRRHLIPTLRAFLLPLAALLLLSGTAGAQTAASARIAFLQLSPDAPALDVYIDSGRVVSSLAFGDSSAYIGIPAGPHTVQFTIASRLDALASVALNAQAGGSYTWVLSGLTNSSDVSATITSDLLIGHVVQLNDTSSNTAGASVRVVNASPGSGPLDVRLAGNSAVTVAENLGYGAVSGYSAVSPGSFTLNVFASGSQTPVESISPVPIALGNAYTIVLGGLLPAQIPANPPNMVQGFTPVLLTDQTLVRTAPLTTGCNQVIFTAPAGTMVQTVLARVANPQLVTSIWRFDNVSKLLKAGYFSDPTAPADYNLTITSPEASFICVSGATTWTPY